jgi:predicted CoA-binding protein
MSKVVAVIGASRNRQKFGNRAVRAYLREGYTVVPIHPTEPAIEGLTACRSVVDVPGAADMASFNVPLSIKTVVACSIVAIGQSPSAL